MEKYVFVEDLVKRGGKNCDLYETIELAKEEHPDEKLITIVLDSTANCGRGCRNFYIGSACVMERYMYPAIGQEANITETEFVTIGDLNDLRDILLKK